MSMELLARFEFATATRILFGPGTVREVASLASSWGRALVVTGSSSARAQPVLDDLSAQGIEAALFPVSGEPSVESVLTGLRQAREAACEVVIGLGGGSVLDTGKAIAALLTNGGGVLDYLEVVGRGGQWVRHEVQDARRGRLAEVGDARVLGASLG